MTAFKVVCLVLPVHAAFACTPTKIGVIYLTRGHSLDSAQLSVLRVLNRRSAGQSRLLNKYQ